MIDFDRRSLEVLNGALREVPVWATHRNPRRVSNWMALISLDPTQPDGIERSGGWIDKAGGEGNYYLVAGLDYGMPVEWGADTKPSSRQGRRKKRRAYGVIYCVGEDFLSYIPCHSAEEACDLAAKMTGQKDEQLELPETVFLRQVQGLLDGAPACELARAIQALVEEFQEEDAPQPAPVPTPIGAAVEDQDDSPQLVAIGETSTQDAGYRIPAPPPRHVREMNGRAQLRMIPVDGGIQDLAGARA